MLRYLVSAWGPEPEPAHHALHRLVFDALARPGLEVDQAPIPEALWSALDRAPRPAFILRYPLRVEQYALNVPLVRRADARPMVGLPTLYGRLLVPDAGPTGEAITLSDARVEASGTQNAAVSGRGGVFRLAGVVPDADGAIHLSIQAKGRTFEVVVHEMGAPGAPATIEVPLYTARLTGRLVDRRGAPLEGVRIELPERRQYVRTRADGTFVVDGLPADRAVPDQIVARQAGEQLDVRIKEGVVVLTGRNDAFGEPVVVQMGDPESENGG
jgi:hypothetical protein